MQEVATLLSRLSQVLGDFEALRDDNPIVPASSTGDAPGASLPEAEQQVTFY